MRPPIPLMILALQGHSLKSGSGYADVNNTHEENSGTIRGKHVKHYSEAALEGCPLPLLRAGAGESISVGLLISTKIRIHLLRSSFHGNNASRL